MNILNFVLELKMTNQITIGDFAFIFGIALVVADDIWQVTLALQNFIRAMGDLKSSLSLLVVPQDNLDLQNANSLVVNQPSIEFKNVKFGYSEHSIFENLNLNIQAGEKIGVVGHSGAGKSSLVNILLKYFAISSGEIYIDNQELSNKLQDSIRANIAVIPQDIILFHRTLLENIRFGKIDASDEEVIDACKTYMNSLWGCLINITLMLASVVLSYQEGSDSG